jgi:phage gp36-like protein
VADVYATRLDLEQHGTAVEALEGLDGTKVAAALAAASRVADGYLAKRCTLPLKKDTDGKWPVDLVRAVCQVASYDLLSNRGVGPEADGGLLGERYRDARRWLEGVADGSVVPPWTDSSADGAPGYDGSFVLGPSADGSVETPTSTRGWC